MHTIFPARAKVPLRLEWSDTPVGSLRRPAMSKPACEFQMTVCWSAGWTVYLSGELDASSGPGLEVVAAALAEARIAAVDFDLSRVTFVDRAGWACLAAALATIRASGAVPRLRNVHPSVLRLTDALENLADTVGHDQGVVTVPGAA
jgi:anti-anti-sigma factor